MSVSWRLFLLLLLLIQLHMVRAIWFPWYFHRFGYSRYESRHETGKANPQTTSGPDKSTSKPSGDGICPPGYRMKEKSTVTCPPGYQLKGAQPSRQCDDNPLVMQLARLYVVSPERIVLLLAQPMLVESCEEITDVLDHIQSATSDCFLAEDNIYGKLAAGLSYYKAEVCDGATNKKRCASLNEAHSCIKELRTDMIECEAPADWYEKGNATKVCQMFNDVLDCYYTRAALLCGLEAARQLRSFAGDSMKRSMIHSCEVNKRLPRVTDPMPIFAASCASASALTTVLLAFNCFIFHI